MINQSRFFRPLPLSLMLLLGVSGVAVVAQIEGGAERGVIPSDNQSAFEVNGIVVDVYGKTADQARYTGWREAQRKGWRMLWQKTHGGNGPALGDGVLDSMVSGIIIEDEQIGPNRYVARLGVLFDRVRAGQILGVSGNYSRSAPLLILPVMWSGGAATTFEQRTEWQKAWARFRAGSSPIDYVRPSGTGADPLLLNAAQTGRRGRMWWRNLLDQYGAADVLVPQARLERLYPGGPVVGHFSARYGPDNRVLQNFQLRAESSAGLPAMLDAAVKRIDAIYGDALASGQLAPDPSLIIEVPLSEEELEAAEKAAEEARAAAEAAARAKNGIPLERIPEQSTPTEREAQSFTIQVATPDVASVSAAEAAVRAIPGVRSASITSLALGGTSVMRVIFDGDAEAIRSAAIARASAATRPRRVEPVVAPRELTEEERKRAEKEARRAEKEREKQEKREREEQKKREKAERKERERLEREQRRANSRDE